ncbi:MAG: hypothetical protein EG825_15965 [Rhodocyclaceae bacterium]|nr:hypothetical protein [Rhodocyclaceae bacterium]
MSPRQLELALKKQRLQLQIVSQREALALHVAGLQPVFTAADQAQRATHWLRRNPETLVAVAVAVLVARPKVVWRWLGRGVLAWRAWARLRGGLDRVESFLASR